jgi:hypothetical protein
MLEYTSTHYFVLYQSLAEIIAWFIVVFRCNHQSVTMVKIFKTPKVVKSTIDCESHIFSKIGDLYLTFSKLVFSLKCPDQKMRRSNFYKIYSECFVIGQAVEKIYIYVWDMVMSTVTWQQRDTL